MTENARTELSFPHSTLVAFFGAPCPWCEIPMEKPTRDHIFPRSLGGTSSKKNTLIICRACNEDKGELPLFSWLQRLQRGADRRADNVRKYMIATGHRLISSVREPS